MTEPFFFNLNSCEKKERLEKERRKQQKETPTN